MKPPYVSVLTSSKWESTTDLYAYYEATVSVGLCNLNPQLTLPYAGFMLIRPSYQLM